MMTVRSEYRISLRPDNADKRLTELGYEYGCVSEERYRKYLETIGKMKLIRNEYNNLKYTHAEWKEMLKSIGVEFNPQDLNRTRNGLALIETYFDLKTKHLNQLFPNEKFKHFNSRIFERLDIESRYKDVIKRQHFAVTQIKREEALELSKDLDYSDPKLNLSKESIEALTKYRPLNVSFD